MTKKTPDWVKQSVKRWRAWDCFKLAIACIGAIVVLVLLLTVLQIVFPDSFQKQPVWVEEWQCEEYEKTNLCYGQARIDYWNVSCCVKDYKLVLVDSVEECIDSEVSKMTYDYCLTYCNSNLRDNPIFVDDLENCVLRSKVWRRV